MMRGIEREQKNRKEQNKRKFYIEYNRKEQDQENYLFRLHTYNNFTYIYRDF